MKKILLGILLHATVVIHAQIDTSSVQFAKYPDSTGFGTPLGQLISKEIGTAGGKIASQDGRVELIFPAGALTKNTPISIQPVTNMRNSSGRAYQLEPSGTRFAKPVKIIFHYTEEEAETCSPDLKSFVLQDHKGKWTSFEYTAWDSTAKTLSGFIHHFSVLVTDENDVMLSPSDSTVAVNDYTLIFILNMNLVETGVLAGANDFAEFAGRRFGVFVNGDPGGNPSVGTISLSGRDSIIPISVRYHAPDILPKQNPVEIKLAFRYYSRKTQKIEWGKAKCTLTVYDRYKILLTHQFTGRGGVGSKLIDSASCIANVYPDRVELTDIKNYEPIVIKEGRQGSVKEKIITTGASGTIHLTRMVRNYALSKDYPPEVYFEPVTFDVLGYKAQYCARGIPCSEIERVDLKTITEEINFIANGRQQKIAFTIGHLDDIENTYKLVVTRYSTRSD